MRIVIAFAALVTSLAAGTPNIVVIFADDMGYGDTSHAGNPTIITPNLDRLASEGMRFTQWYSGFHVCSPSRASMLTGRIPIRSGCAGGRWTGGVFPNDAVGGLPQNETTFAKILKTKGYASLAIGKWHLGQQEKFLPVAHGFDEYLGIPYSVDMAKSAWDMGGYGAQISLPLIHNTTVIEQPANLNTLDERYAAKAVDFVTKNAKSQTPFVLYFACNHVHVPDYASKNFCNSSKRGRFGDAMNEMDNSIGTLMKGIKAAGVDEETIVFFTSDNGPWLTKNKNGGSAGPLFEGKTTTWEGGIREPAIVRWPGKVPAGTISTEVAATYDIFATAVALAGAKLPSDRYIDGKDLSGVLLRGETSPHKCLFHYKGFPSTGLPPAANDPKPGLWAIRCGAYKVHYVTQCSIMQSVGDSRCSSTLASPEDTTDHPNVGAQSAPRVHNPPLLYNVEHDINEFYPIDSTSDEYKAAMDIITKGKQEHEATLTPVPNQMGMGGQVNLANCCNGDLNNTNDPLGGTGYKEASAYPLCTCNPENFDDIFVCKPVFENVKNDGGPGVSKFSSVV